jgi:hypothetical protein
MSELVHYDAMCRAIAEAPDALVPKIRCAIALF